MSPIQKSNSWGNRVVHADIHVNSIDEGEKDDDRASVAGSQHSRAVSRDEEQIRTSEMQLWWDEAIARNMDLPEGYQHVAVLIIKWTDHLDELKTSAEALELEEVFREKFRFKTQIVELNISSKPQHQLNSHLSSFVEKNDGSHNLMIVYYTGHGIWREDKKYLELTASMNPAVKRGFRNEARCNWNRAEVVLRSEDTDGDVLTILDTCFSSNMVKSGKEDTRIYELLSACIPNGTTASPGDNSFTRALIKALNDLLVRYKGGGFTTFRLNEIINLMPTRQEMQSQLWNRLQHHDRHIRLAPLKVDLQEEGEASLLHRPRSYLTLRFALRHTLLSRDQVEDMTKMLAQSFSNKALVRGIDWLTFKPARTTHLKPTALAIIVFKRWRKFVKRRKEERLRRVDEVVVPMVGAPSESGTSTSPTRKRIREGNDEYPQSKRGSLGLTQRPLTPMSDLA